MGKEVSMSEVSMVCLATQDDLNMWLWELAAKGYVFNKYARERILRVIADDGLRSYAERILPLFNQTVQAVYNSPGSPANLLKQERQERHRQNNESNILLHEAKMMYQKEVTEFKMQTATGRRIAERLLLQLQAPQDRLLQAYDLTREDDIEAYLEWYRLLQRPVSQSLIDMLESSPRYLNQAPLTLLRNKVQQYHASLEL